MAYNKERANDAPELIEKVVYLNRVSKTVKGGRVMKFSALVVVGDGKGTVGYGLGKAAEVSEAILKGIADAKKNMVKVTLSGTTIPHEVIAPPAVQIHRLADRWVCYFIIPMQTIHSLYGKLWFLPGDKLRGNFYKCGEKTPQPHWGSWTKLSGDTPQLHQPASFGDLEIDTTRL